VDTATDTLRLLTDFAIDDMDFDIPFLAMGIRDLRLTGADYDLQAPQPLRLFANVDLDIFKGANAAGTEVLAIEMDSFRADLSIGGVLIGGTSIGSVMLDDLAITNTSMRIYGH
jgi:NADH:ubiquinone oxidoreductase subunit D